VEAADAASVARLVRGVCCCQVTQNALLLSSFWLMLVWCLCGQAGAGLGELRSPAVRNDVLFGMAYVKWWDVAWCGGDVGVVM